ncbi:hypothetical protein Ancab_013053 [Ancistrocladus abbreviatus]
MTPNPKLTRALREMRSLGIPSDLAKAVIKRLLKVYDNNWGFIEDKNYQVLLEAIFECEGESKEQKVNSKKKVDCQHDGLEEHELSIKQSWSRDPLDNSSSKSGKVCASPNVEEAAMSTACKGSGVNQPLQLCVASQNCFQGETPVQPRRSHEVEYKKKVGHQHDDLEDLEEYEAPLKRSRIGHYVQNSTPTGGEAYLGEHLEESAPSKACLVPAADETLRLCVPSQNWISEETHGDLPISGVGLKFCCQLEAPNQIPEVEVPISVIHPELPIQPYVDGSSSVDCSGDKLKNSEVHEFEPLVRGDKLDSVSDLTEKVDRLEFGPSALNDKDGVSHMEQFDIVSSSRGGMKVSLIVRSGFRLPNIELAIKEAGEKLSRTYNINEPGFSVMEVLGEFCDSILKLGSDCDGDMEVRDPTVATNLDPANNSFNGQKMIVLLPEISEPLDMNSLECIDHQIDSSKMVNGSCNYTDEEVGDPTLAKNHDIVNFFGGQDPAKDNSDHQNMIGLLPEMSKPKDFNYLDCIRLQGDSNKMVNGSIYCEENEVTKALNVLESPISCSMVLHEGWQCSSPLMKPPIFVDDITNGEESVKISLVSEINIGCSEPSFKYISQNMVFKSACVNFSFSRVSDGNCCSSCYGNCLASTFSCACACQNGGEFAYTLDGLLKEKFLDECIFLIQDPQKRDLHYCKDCPLERFSIGNRPCKGHLVRKFIKECWYKCGCSKYCANRVVQRGIVAKLQVFWTPDGRGWGVRTLEDLPRGAFVCEFVGEIVTGKELYERNMQQPGKEVQTYCVLLDADWVSGSGLKDEEALCLDAKFYGNVARFINHRTMALNLMIFIII